jgi:hypothetical protein
VSTLRARLFRPFSEAGVVPTSTIDSRAAANPLLLVRVLLGSAVSVAVGVAGFKVLLEARALAEAANASRPEFFELGLRSAGIALLAAAQVIAVLAVIRGCFPPRVADRMFTVDRLFTVACGLVFAIAALGAIISILTGR